MKNILITGATGGIGEATAKYLVEQGYYVVCVGRNKNKLHQMHEEHKDHILPISFDLRNFNEIQKIFEQCKIQGIKLDGMVHCAGMGPGHMPVRQITCEQVQVAMEVNCLSFIEMSKYMVSRKYSNEGASIVVLSSLSSWTTYPGTTSYSVSKGALNTACKVLAKEAIQRKIRVNTLLPGYVKTNILMDLDMENLMKGQPLGYIEPIEIAYMVEFLLSDKSRKITCAEIPVSAGMQF